MASFKISKLARNSSKNINTNIKLNTNSIRKAISQIQFTDNTPTDNVGTGFFYMMKTI